MMKRPKRTLFGYSKKHVAVLEHKILTLKELLNDVITERVQFQEEVKQAKKVWKLQR